MPGNKDPERKRQIVRESQRRRRERLRQAGQTEKGLSKEYRFARKKQLVEYRGGKCVSCGYLPITDLHYNVLEFHHRDPTTKSFSIATKLMRAWDILKAEADKCDVLCANCHRLQKTSYSLGGRPQTIFVTDCAVRKNDKTTHTER